MTHEETMRLYILKYPLISSTNGEIQTHMFITIGNGLRWENGELVSCYGDDTEVETEKTVKDYIFDMLDSYKKESNPWNILCRRNPSVFIEYIKKQISTILDCETILKQKPEVYFDSVSDRSFLYISRYSKIYDLPDEITGDWFDAVISFISHLEPYISYDPEQAGFISEIREKLGRIKVI